MTIATMQRTTTRRPLLIVVALVVALGAVVWFSGVWQGATVRLVREPVNQQLGAATRADVTIALGVGHLRIGALEEPGALIAGEITYSDQHSVARGFAIDGDVATFTLREQDNEANNLVKYRDNAPVWDLRLAPAMPLRLTLEAGIGEGTIDLAHLHVTDLALEAGVGNTTLTLPQQGQVHGRVNGGVGNVTIRVPAGVAARLVIDTGLGNVNVPPNYWREGNVAVSPGYELAANRVELTVNGGIGNITIEHVGE